MKLLLVGLVCATQNFHIVDETLMHLLKVHSSLFLQNYGQDGLAQDSLLTYKPFIEFPIDEKSDTIYIRSVSKSGDGVRVLIWKRGYVLPIYKGALNPRYSVAEQTYMYYKDNKVYNYLVDNWEPKMLKYLGEEYTNSQSGYPYRPSQHCLTRIILKNGKEIIDTVTYSGLGDIETLTYVQLDSIREAVNNVYEDQEITVNLNKKVVDMSNPPEKQVTEPIRISKSIWQRIADWFISLWHSIFG